jgi:hypothetical protein
MIVGGGPVDNPPSGALALARRVPETAVILRQVGVFHADEMEFAFARFCDFVERVAAAFGHALSEAQAAASLESALRNSRRGEGEEYGHARYGLHDTAFHKGASIVAL